MELGRYDQARLLRELTELEYVSAELSGLLRDAAPTNRPPKATIGVGTTNSEPTDPTLDIHADTAMKDALPGYSHTITVVTSL